MTTPITIGPPRYYAPVCVQRPLGFYGGPIGYQEVAEGEKGRGPIIINTKPPEEKP